MCHDLELAVPGTYDPNNPVVRIAKVESALQVGNAIMRNHQWCIVIFCCTFWIRSYVKHILERYFQVITSKQRPRKLCIRGSNGKEFMFLLKGHEDLRQDERVMQLFGLVNTLLSTSHETLRYHACKSPS